MRQLLLLFLTSILTQAATDIIPRPSAILEGNKAIIIPKTFSLTTIGKKNKNLHSYSVETLADDHGISFQQNDSNAYRIIFEIDPKIDEGKDFDFFVKEGYDLITTKENHDSCGNFSRDFLRHPDTAAINPQQG